MNTQNDSPQYYSQVSAAAMHQELDRLRAEVAQLRNDVTYWEAQTNHWYMKANYTPAQIAEFTRRRTLTIDSDTGEWLPLPQHEKNNRTIATNSSIRYNGTAGGSGDNENPGPEGRAPAPAPTKGNGMSIITATGNLAATPKLREGDKGPYTYARIAVSDRVRQEDGSYTNGPTIYYDVAISGVQARQLVATAERSGNVRVMFSGRYRVTEWKSENGTQVKHEVQADQVGISLRGQSVTVEREAQGAPDADGENDTETPY